MAHTTEVITAPVSVADVKAVLSVESNSVGVLCSHGNINPWSRYKPIRDNNPTLRLTENNAYRGGGVCGMSVRKFTRLSALMDAVASRQWEYAPPSGKYLSAGSLSSITLTKELWTPYRLGDFDKYQHNAPCPLQGFSAPMYITRENNQVFSCRLIDGFLLADQDLIIGDINDSAPAETDYSAPGALTLKELVLWGVPASDMYFGVAAFKKSESAVNKYTLMWARSNKIKGSKTFTGPFDCNTATSGMTVYLMPFWSPVIITTLNYNDEGAFYIPPQCSAQTCKVNSSELASDIMSIGLSAAGRAMINIDGTPSNNISYVEVNYSVTVGASRKSFTGCTLQLFEGNNYMSPVWMSTHAVDDFTVPANSTYRKRDVFFPGGHSITTGKEYRVRLSLNKGAYFREVMVMLPASREVEVIA